MGRIWSTFGVFLAVAGASGTAAAVEGGSGAYLLGGRDLKMGIVPPPGLYVSNEFTFIDGNVGLASIGGAVVSDVDLDVFLYRFSPTYVFDLDLLGGTPALNLTVPFATGKLTFDGAVGGTFSGEIEDRKTGLGDIVMTPLMGWHHGNFHYSLAVPVFLPTGAYDTAEINFAERSARVLSIGKNKVAVDPTAALTWLDPASGREASGALGITFNDKNGATNYQTGEELHIEVSAGQNLPQGFALGVAGYYYQQIADDSGGGADNFKRALGTDDLKARVFGIGPVATFMRQLGPIGVNAKVKFFYEFERRRRFESNVLSISLGISW